MSKEYLEVVELYKSIEKEKDENAERYVQKRRNLNSLVNLTLSYQGFEPKNDYNGYVFYQRENEVFVKKDIVKGLSSEFNYALATVNPDDFEEFKNKCCVKAYPNQGLSIDEETLPILGMFGAGVGSCAIIGLALGGAEGVALGFAVSPVVGFFSALGSCSWFNSKRRKKDKKKIKNFDEEYNGKIIYNEQALERLFRGDIK